MCVGISHVLIASKHGLALLTLKNTNVKRKESAVQNQLLMQLQANIFQIEQAAKQNGIRLKDLYAQSEYQRKPTGLDVQDVQVKQIERAEA
jgi:hypothetical protein